MNIKVVLSLFISCLGILCSYGQNTIPTRDYHVEIENESVHQYIQDVFYEPHDKSVIDNYRKGIEYREDWPNPVMMDIPQSTADSLYIICYDNKTLLDSLKFRVSADANKAELYNFIPNRTYRYQIKDDVEILQQGKIYTSGQLRQIKVCNTVSNVRDLGGWKTTDNMQVRYGKIFRGTDLNGTHIATNEGIEILRGLGITAELDLRADYNEGHNISAFGFTSNGSNEEVPTYYYSSSSGELPSHLTKVTYLKKWRLAFQFIVNNLSQGRTIYEHCVWGRDRTGYLSFFLEGLLGVPYSDLAKDYELTFFSYTSKSTKDSIDKVFDYIETMPGETLREKFNAFFVNKLNVQQSDIDYFRSEMLEQKNSATAIKDIQRENNMSKDELLYDMDGRRVEVIKKGHLYIIKNRHGYTRKVFY